MAAERFLVLLLLLGLIVAVGAAAVSRHRSRVHRAVIGSAGDRSAAGGSGAVGGAALLVFGLVTMPVAFGFGLRAGPAIVLAITPSVACALAGGFWLHHTQHR